MIELSVTIAIALMAMTFVGFAVILPILQTAYGLGVPHEKNFGQCKQDKNRNACQNNKDSFTGPN